MRITLKFIASLTVGIALVAFLFAYLQVREITKGMRHQAEIQAQSLADILAGQVEPVMSQGAPAAIDRIVQRFQEGKHLAGAAVYDAAGQVVYSTGVKILPVAQDPAPVGVPIKGKFVSASDPNLLEYVRPLNRDGARVGELAVTYRTDSFRRQWSRMGRNAFLRALAEVGLIAIITLVIIRRSIFGPMARTLQWLREARTTNILRRPRFGEGGVLKPLAQEVTHLVRSLESARAAASEEARLREARESIWTAERLRAHIHNKVQGRPLYVVSNREPYIHMHRGNGISVEVPASGLVTALEPILCACNGTWIAHGSGTADAEVADALGRVRVPPDRPEYTLRRVWLTSEEEDGYYYGFANEGLWPLCHIAHTRPVFRASDWANYQKANEKFARAVLEEISGVEGAIVLAQDYHFALLPRLIKAERPDARVAIFWHIPWPNPEAFRICPWRRELLDGLLAADLVGFHIQAHCNNFLDTVDRALEARIEWERFAVRRAEHITHVRPFPISVDFREHRNGTGPAEHRCRAQLLRNLGLSAERMGVGVDRIDYTKGILERFRALERFFEKYPEYCGRFAFVQIGSPSRTHIPKYNDLVGEVQAEAERINARFRTGSWRPIALLTEHHSHPQIEQYYRAADICLVTSLHDGMNLVAKEFVASREDNDGVLLLSEFTGAARELRDALVVNPYDTEQIADTIHFALAMDSGERQSRMGRMRQTIREHNVFRWAGSLIGNLCEIRLEEPEHSFLQRRAEANHGTDAL